MSKYEISKIRSMDNEVRFVIYNHEEHAFFAGYDFMGSVNWEYSNVPSEACELTAEDDPEQIVADLESADEPAEPAPMIKVTCWSRKHHCQAYFYAVRIARELKCSIRFEVSEGRTITVHRNDILSIEY